MTQAGGSLRAELTQRLRAAEAAVARAEADRAAGSTGDGDDGYEIAVHRAERDDLRRLAAENDIDLRDAG